MGWRLSFHVRKTRIMYRSLKKTVVFIIKQLRSLQITISPPSPQPKPLSAS